MTQALKPRYLIQVDFVKVEPLSDKNNYWSTQLVRAALIKTPEAGYLGQVLRLGSPQKSFISLVMLERVTADIKRMTRQM